MISFFSHLHTIKARDFGALRLGVFRGPLATVLKTIASQTEPWQSQKDRKKNKKEEILFDISQMPNDKGGICFSKAQLKP